MKTDRTRCSNRRVSCRMTLGPQQESNPVRDCAMRISLETVPSLLVVAVLMGGSLVIAQTVTVDATPSHVVNKFSPMYALGSTVDRVPSNATDVFFRPDQIKKVLSAGWGVISYRQNTDLFVQAWH